MCKGTETDGVFGFSKDVNPAQGHVCAQHVHRAARASEGSVHALLTSAGKAAAERVNFSVKVNGHNGADKLAMERSGSGTHPLFFVVFVLQNDDVNHALKWQ